MLKNSLSPLFSLVRNLFLIFIAYFVCRTVFLLENLSLYSDYLTLDSVLSIYRGGLCFDTSAILYTNILYITLVLLPLPYRTNKVYRDISKWIFIVINSLALIINLADSVYFQYTGRRTTMTVFHEFENENNLLGIFIKEIYVHWYFLLLAVIMIYALIKLYRDFGQYERPSKSHIVIYYLGQILVFLFFGFFTVAGMRGGFTRETRPITISNANQYVRRPLETAIVLNTPFSLIRTFDKKPFIVPDYFADRNEMQDLYSPIHLPNDSLMFKPVNVVVLIMESFGSEYIGALNKDKENYDGGYTSFLDSLISESLVFRHSFSNGKKSIDGLPSVLSGIPMFVEPFFLSEASLNSLTSIGGELRKKGYYTAFYHGASRGSMGFMAYSRACGYEDYYGREDYGNDSDFDGSWAIWDEEFMQYMADELDKKTQPFCIGFFSASSHHPFNIPERYKEKFNDPGHGIYKCIRYSDNALRMFFDKVSKMDWFENTLFVITGDHTNYSERPEYLTEAGAFSVPVIFYHPSDTTFVGLRDGISQQIDIMPTVLGYLNYDKPYISFGCDLLNTRSDQTFAVNYLNGIYQYFRNDYLLQFDGEKSVALYDFVSDPLLKNNVISDKQKLAGEMEKILKSIIQQYMERMNSDELIYRTSMDSN